MAVLGHVRSQMREIFRKSILINHRRLFSTETNDTSKEIEDDEFRVLELYPMAKFEKRAVSKYTNPQMLPPRETRMPIDQDWPSVWPMPQSFRPSVVPLPVYQGYSEKKAPPGKYANAELMKIPNFLHLTPPAVKRHCAAIKKFCTEWPKGLETEEDCEKHFPIEIITSDYCHSSPTIRDERSRIVTLKIRVRSLNLDYHARDKLLRLVGSERYDAVHDVLTIVADRCPLRKQNYDYLMYLLTAAHHESWVTEPWEHEKTEADMEKFFYEGSRIEDHILNTVATIKAVSESETDVVPEQLKEAEEVTGYAEAVTQLINEGENAFTINQYKEKVLRALSLDCSQNEQLEINT